MTTENEIKPIETVYNGYRFRSRLEARWAVFFDAMDIEREYMPEGFELGNGVWYLPDFYLEGIGYAEVKHKFTEEEREKYRVFGEKVGTCVLLEGAPAVRYYDQYPAAYAFDAMAFLWYEGDHWYRAWGADTLLEQLFSPSDKEGRKLLNAVDAARLARLEHGETP